MVIAKFFRPVKDVLIIDEAGKIAENHAQSPKAIDRDH
jgi:hypothetical protein